jgi:hypothetical protein
MQLADEPVLDSFRKRCWCEWCRRDVHTGTDPAHVYSRGAGRVDHPLNLVALCRRCHTASHLGQRPTRDDLLEIVSRREGVSRDAVVAFVHAVRRAARDLPPDPRDHDQAGDDELSLAEDAAGRPGGAGGVETDPGGWAVL